MSLSKPHPLWTSCSNNSYEVSRAVVQARILSGRYKTDRLTRYLLLHCPSLSHTRQNMRNDFSPRTKSLINNILESQSVRDKVQLLLDSSCLPEVIANHQLGQHPPLIDLFNRFAHSVWPICTQFGQFANLLNGKLRRKSVAHVNLLKYFY